MLNSKEVLDQLESLVRLDIDAVHAYSEAIDRIDLPDVKRNLSAFRNDHERHVVDLSSIIEQLGGKAPKRTPDLKGFFIQGFTAIRSMTGNEGALKAMKGNEELTNKTYSQALERELPEDVRAVVQKNRDDERRHLQYIMKCINERVWEEALRKAA